MHRSSSKRKSPRSPHSADRRKRSRREHDLSASGSSGERRMSVRKPEREHHSSSKSRNRRSPTGSRSRSRSRSPHYRSRSRSPLRSRSHRSGRSGCSDRHRLSDRSSVSTAPAPPSVLDPLTLKAIEEVASRIMTAQLGRLAPGHTAPEPPSPSGKRGSGGKKVPPRKGRSPSARPSSVAGPSGVLNLSLSSGGDEG